MDLGNFTSPLRTVQTISVFTYLNTLSDFLFSGNFLNETNQYQPIPIVNALYNYFLDDYQEDRLSQISFEFFYEGRKASGNYRQYNYSTVDYNENRTAIIRLRKEFLARKLIEGTDLYGAGENEILDEAFIDALFRHLVTNLVFEKYTNIYGFLIDIVRQLESVDVELLREGIIVKLSKEVFLSENGVEGKLEDFVIWQLLQEFIFPLLPESKSGDINLLSMDYVYAQAGAVFQQSIETPVFLEKSLLDISRKVDKEDPHEEFRQNIVLGHAVEQLVATGRMERAALGIFALPAFLRYVLKEPEKIKNQTTANILNNSTLVMEIFAEFFGHLRETFTRVEEAKQRDYRYQFHSALSKFKNRTTLAREMIRSQCQVEEDCLEQEVLKYKNNPDDYECRADGKGKKLEDLNLIYQQEVNQIAEKYLRYERESIRDAFGEEVIGEIDKGKVEISKGLIRYFVDGFQVYESQLLGEADDLFRFHFTGSGESNYYAILRKDNDLKIFREDTTILGCSGSPNGSTSANKSTSGGTMSPNKYANCGLMSPNKSLFDDFKTPNTFDLCGSISPDTSGSSGSTSSNKSAIGGSISPDTSGPTSSNKSTVGGSISPDTSGSTSSNKSTVGGSTSPDTSGPSGSTSPNDSEKYQKPSTNSIVHCNPVELRKKLNLQSWQSFQDNYFPILKKQKEESFDTFLTRVAMERTSNFNKTLALEGYDQTRKEWWKDFGLSLIPFYTCSHAIRAEDFDQAKFACSMDILFALPLVGELGYLATKLTTAFTRSIILSAGTTLGSLTLRTTMREILSVVLTEAEHFTALFSKETIKELGVSVLRYLDPGFELIYSIGKGGLRVLNKLVGKLTNSRLSTKVFEKLAKTETKLSKPFLKVDKFQEKDIVVNSYSSELSGYGYRSVHHHNQVIHFRKVGEYREIIPVVPMEQEGTFRAINLETGHVKPKVLHSLDGDISLIGRTDSPNEMSFRLNSFHDSQQCLPRRKRSPKRLLCLRNVLRDRRQIVERAAMDYVRQHTELSEIDVRDQLRKFVFPGDGKLQLKFVTDWRDMLRNGEKTKLPAWSKQYEIHDPETFEKLRYADTMDKWSINKIEASQRMNHIYPPSPENHLSAAGQAPFVAKFYESDKAFESVTFEDYFALKNYMGSGYRRIGRNTIEAKFMREALYRLAIRQSDDPIQEYAKTLYRGESRSPEVVQKLFFSGKEEIEFNRFTSASASRRIANKFQFNTERDVVRILYQMEFSQPFFRAKVENVVSNFQEEESVLLPGSRFRIDDVHVTTMFGENILEIKLTFKHDDMPKHMWYKKIMDELENLKKKGPTNYEIDPPNHGSSNFQDFLDFFKKTMGH